MRYIINGGTRQNLPIKKLAWALVAVAALIVIYIFIKVTLYLP